MITAKVHRPAFDTANPNLPNPEVTLTATVSHGSVSKPFDLKLIVRREGMTNSQAVVLDANGITIPTETRTDLTLPVLGANGSAISWASSDAAIIDVNGKVVRPDNSGADTDITLTATCTKGTATQDTTFTVKVFKWTINEEVDDAFAKVDFDLIKGTNVNSQAIEDNLVLPAIVGRSVTATWSLVSSSVATGMTTGVIDMATGVVTQPTYTQGQVSVQIKCTLTKDTITKEKILPPYILAPAPMTDAEVLASAKSLLESSKFLGTSNTDLTHITDDMQLPYSLTDPNASRATIAWSLVTAGTHAALASSPNLSLSPQASYCYADVTRPVSGSGNVSTVALKASLTVGSLNDERYFDLVILALL